MMETRLKSEKRHAKRPGLPLKVLVCAAEVYPFAKVGGLADVAGSLPRALRRLGADARIAMPRYSTISGETTDMPVVAEFDVTVGSRSERARVYQGSLPASNGDPAVPVYFIGNEHYFDRDGVYGMDDDAARFAFFSRAIVAMLPRLGFSPDVIHCNDWQTGLVPVYVGDASDPAGHDGCLSQTATVYTVHNLQYQGLFTADAFDLTGLDRRHFSIDGLEFYGGINLMKAGLVYSDVINTVSRCYAKEIQTPEYGERLDGVLRARRQDLFGIVNGIDYTEFNPETDRRLAYRYAPGDVVTRRRNKAALQRELGLPRREVPVIGIVSRLVGQKGLDILAEALEDLMLLDIQFVLLGTGEPYFHDVFRALGNQYPQKASINLRFDLGLAQRIYAAGDMFLMPSRFEPCGLGQLISLRYGCIPVVRSTGGLADTIEDCDPDRGTGNGFVFHEYSGSRLREALLRALRLYRDAPGGWQGLMQRAMACDFSWNASAAEYMALYREALSRRIGLATDAV